MTTQHKIKRRRTHSVHETYGDAKDAANNLARLMGGVPSGYVFVIWPRMGKFAFVSMPVVVYQELVA